MFRHMSDTKYFYTLKLVISWKCIKQNWQLTDNTKVILLKLLSMCYFQIKQQWRVHIIFFAAHCHFWPKILKSTHTHTSWNNHNDTVHIVNMLQSPIKQHSYTKKTIMTVMKWKMALLLFQGMTDMSSFCHELITGKKDKIFKS
jgi:hypothetical protein